MKTSTALAICAALIVTGSALIMTQDVPVRISVEPSILDAPTPPPRRQVSDLGKMSSSELTSYRSALGVAISHCHRRHPELICPSLEGAMREALKVSERHATCVTASVLLACLNQTAWLGWAPEDTEDGCDFLIEVLEHERLRPEESRPRPRPAPVERRMP